jgi:hypothetical protein
VAFVSATEHCLENKYLIFLVVCVVMFVCFLLVFLLLSDVPIVASVSGLSILYYPFVYIYMFEFGLYIGKRKFQSLRGRRGRDRMVVGFTTTYAISAYHH